MSARDLKRLLEVVADTREIVLQPAPPDDHALTGGEALLATWWTARAAADDALAAWRRSPGADAYAVYRAAEDRADAAQDAVAAARS